MRQRLNILNQTLPDPDEPILFPRAFRVVPVTPRSPTKTRIMNPYIPSLLAGTLAGVVYGLIDVQSPGF
ncbi:hypothetical protein OKW41_002558 [Paraburkholderia sp. UCT70]